jgi:aspartate 1-decarboxylase
VGFNTNPLEYDINNPKVLVEYFSEKKPIDIAGLESLKKQRKNFKRTVLSNLIIGLKINNTHPDCLHGSAEIPNTIMNACDLKQYQHVLVYNATLGGAADTYSVPMPEGIIMTTGAMAKFAKLGEVVNVSSFIETAENVNPKIVLTDGTNILKSHT